MKLGELCDHGNKEGGTKTRFYELVRIHWHAIEVSTENATYPDE